MRTNIECKLAEALSVARIPSIAASAKLNLGLLITESTAPLVPSCNRHIVI